LKHNLSASNAGIDFGSGVNNGHIRDNDITGVYSESTGGWGAYGINFSSTTNVDNNTISNNFISDIRGVNYSTGSTTFNAFGIRLAGGTNTKIYYNAINLFGDITIVSGAPTQPNSANLVITTSSVTGLDVRNNIFRNVQTFISGSPKTYNIWAPESYTGFVSINHNDYFGTNGPMGNPTTFHVGRVGDVGQHQFSQLAGIHHTGCKFSEHCPIFTSPTDLHIDISNNAGLVNLGTPIAGITTDIDGDVRDVTTPDIGADEWDQPTDAVDWGNLQWPPNGTIFPQNTYVSYGQAWEPGVTDMTGQGAGLNAWVGWSNSNTDPATWPTGNWISAPFNVDAGNNDEFSGTFPANTFTAGIYYYAYRYQLNGGPYRYGAYSTGGGGFWDGTTYVNGVLTVNACPSYNSFGYTILYLCR
jgi:hypothetical protein